MKYLIVNADDFGYSFSINKGIIEAHTKGIVTSTTVMIDAIGAEEAKDLTKYDLSIGLHFFPTSLDIIEEELKRQIDKFKAIVGRKPDHIDTHKREPTDIKEIEDVLRRYSTENKIPIRGFGYVKFIDTFFGLNVDGSGELNEDNISVDSLKHAIDEATDEFNEIMCHVGYSDDYLRDNSSYNDVREKELKSITNSEIKEYIENNKDLKLCDWRLVAENKF